MKRDRIEELDRDDHHSVHGERREKSDSAQHLTIDGSLHLSAGQAWLTESGRELHIKAGQKVVLEAGSELTLKAGGSFLKVDGGGITIVGPSVKVNAGGSPGSGTGQGAQAPLRREGVHEHVPLFAATPLAPLQEAGPWAVRIEAGSDAWRAGEALCRERRLGWCCQPLTTTVFAELIAHLQGLFVWADPHSGQSLVNLQDPAALTALLGSAEPAMLAHIRAPFGELATPTPSGHWQAWQGIEPGDATDASPRLTPDMEAALRSAPQAWFLAERLGIRLDEVDADWLEGLAMLNRHGITRARHLESLPPYVQRAAWREREESREILDTDQPAWRKVKALRARMETLQAQDRDTHPWTM